MGLLFVEMIGKIAQDRHLRCQEFVLRAIIYNTVNYLHDTQWSVDCALCVDRKTLENIILPNILITVHYHAAIILSYNFIVYQSIIRIRGAIIIVLLTMRGIDVTREP